jgi:hypothetical protein
MAISTASHERSFAVSRVYSETSPPMLCASLPSAFWLVICPPFSLHSCTARVFDALDDHAAQDLVAEHAVEALGDDDLRALGLDLLDGVEQLRPVLERPRRRDVADLAVVVHVLVEDVARVERPAVLAGHARFTARVWTSGEMASLSRWETRTMAMARYSLKWCPICSRRRPRRVSPGTIHLDALTLGPHNGGRGEAIC